MRNVKSRENHCRKVIEESTTKPDRPFSLKKLASGRYQILEGDRIVVGDTLTHPGVDLETVEYVTAEPLEHDLLHGLRAGDQKPEEGGRFDLLYRGMWRIRPYGVWLREDGFNVMFNRNRSPFMLQEPKYGLTTFCADHQVNGHKDELQLGSDWCLPDEIQEVSSALKQWLDACIDLHASPGWALLQLRGKAFSAARMALRGSQFKYASGAGPVPSIGTKETLFAPYWNTYAHKGKAAAA